MHLRPVAAITKKKGIIAQGWRKRKGKERGDKAGRKRQRKSYIMYIMLRPVNLSVSVCV